MFTSCMKKQEISHGQKQCLVVLGDAFRKNDIILIPRAARVFYCGGAFAQLHPQGLLRFSKWRLGPGDEVGLGTL